MFTGISFPYLSNRLAPNWQYKCLYMSIIWDLDAVFAVVIFSFENFKISRIGRLFIFENVIILTTILHIS